MTGVTAPVLSWRATRPHGSWLWWLGVLACTGCTIAAPQIRSARLEVTKAAAVQDLTLTLADALAPAVRELADVIATAGLVPADQRSASVPLVQLVVDTVATFIGPSRVRANFFAWEAESPNELVPVRSSGRSRPPRTIFQRGTPAGDAAFDMLANEGDRFVVDTRATDLPGWDPDRVIDYQTFLAVPVTAGRLAFGMLTVDAVTSGDLAIEDVPLARVFAQVLGAGLASIASRRES